MVRVLPDDVLAFIGTSGVDELKPNFEETVLARMWDDPGVQTFYQSIEKELLSKLRQGMQDPGAVRKFETVADFIKLVVNRPIIMGAALKEVKDGPPIYGFAIIDAGPRKAEIASALSRLEALVDKGDIIETSVGSLRMHGPRVTDDVTGYWGWVENHFVFAINDGEGLAIEYLQKSRTAAPGQLKKVPGTDDALALYVDCQRIVGLVKTVTGQEGASEQLNQDAVVVKELGLNNVKSFAARLGFAGPDVVSSEFLEVPQPRRGILADVGTINLSMFDMVDARAVNTATVNWDFAGMYDTTMGAIKAATPGDVYAEIQNGIASFESKAELNIHKGLLENLSGPMVYYALPSGITVEVPGGGAVVIAKLKDAPLFEKTMIALGSFAAAKSKGKLQVSSQVQSDGRTVHSWLVPPLAIMQILPCWTVVNNHFVIASNPALHNIAVKQVTSVSLGTESIRNTEGYKKVTAALPDNLISFSYTDSKVQLKQLMMGLQQFWPMITVTAAKKGVRLPAILPSAAHIAEDMKSSCQYAWFDAEGLHSHYRGPGLEPGLGALAGASLGAGIMMPALARVRHISKRMVSGTNLSAVGKALLIYANDHNDQYPPNLQELVEEAELPPKSLESPLKPRGFDGPSYIYISGQTIAMHPGNIIVYDNPAFCREGVNVLFNDTHVQWIKPAEFLKELEATYRRLGREMPEVKFKDSGKELSGSWISELGAEYEFKDDSFVCTYVPDYLAKPIQNWKGKIILKEIKKIKQSKYSCKQVVREPKENFEVAYWVDAEFEISGDIMVLKYSNLGKAFERKFKRSRGSRLLRKPKLPERWGASSDSVGKEAKSFPLHTAASKTDLEKIGTLIAERADVNARNNKEETTLYLAIPSGHTDVAELLIDKGADVNEKDEYGWTLLHWVAFEGHRDIAELLIANGADVNVRDDLGHTPLWWAEYKGNKEMIGVLRRKELSNDVSE
jgi:hypothetical protein